MASYDILGKFYDAVMGDRADASQQLRRLIRRASPKAKNILELACGTGSVLKHLSKYYDVWGLDLSRNMLSIARKKVPEARLSRQNMVTFHLQLKFDVICCVFDSMNHVANFTHWKQLFGNVHSTCRRVEFLSLILIRRRSWIDTLLNRLGFTDLGTTFSL
jgi:SAM-dependent methyltransferase